MIDRLPFDNDGNGAMSRVPAAEDLPVLALCDPGGSGASAAAAALASGLRAGGLRVAVVPERAGRHAQGSPGAALAGELWPLVERNDLVLVDAPSETPLPKIWLGAQPPPSHVGHVLAWFRPAPRGREALAGFVADWLARQWPKPPVYAAVLIGGRSTRMGSPKHLLQTGGKTWLQRTVERVREVADWVVLGGDGAVPDALADLPRVSDAPEAAGPLAGILAALRWAPHATWLVAACDLPNLSVEALQWLLSTRRPGVWATVPRLPGSPGIEPLLAHYDFRARPCLEELAAEGIFRPGRIVRSGKAICPTPPGHLVPAWTNVNTRAELHWHGSGED